VTTLAVFFLLDQGHILGACARR